MAKFQHISYSYLNAFACPYQAFLRYEGKIRGSTTYQLALGSAVHLALEQMYHDPEPLPKQNTINIFDQEFMRIIEEEEVFVGYPQLKKSQAEGAHMIDIYYDGMEKGVHSKRPFKVEEPFSLEIAGVNIVGKIDKIEEIENGLDVIDYKSGKKKPEEWFLRRNLQFTAYAWATKQLYGEYPARITWHHLRTGELLHSTRDEWDIEQLKRSVSAAVKMQDQDIRYRVYNEQICGWCDYAGHDKECDDQELEKTILARRESV